MLAAHVAAEAPPATSAREDISRTVLIPRLGPAQESVSTDEPKRRAASRCAWSRAGGPARSSRSTAQHHDRRGRGDTALVIRRGRSYFLARLSAAARLGSTAGSGPGTHPIAPQDMIDVGGWSFEVIDAEPRENKKDVRNNGAARRGPGRRPAGRRWPTSLNERLALTAGELARSQTLLREAPVSS
jgi:hypothetical protein